MYELQRLKTEEIQRFYSYLEDALEKLESDKNVNKPHWDTMSREEIMSLLEIEVKELAHTVQYGRDVDIVNECKDVINLALFMMDK